MKIKQEEAIDMMGNSGGLELVFVRISRVILVIILKAMTYSEFMT